MHQEKIQITGNSKNPTKALIMLHGRGGSAEDILSLSQYIKVQDFLLLAPQATNHTWYPQSFLALPSNNEPWLSSALDLVGKSVEKALLMGIKKENIYFLGFSQGACLAMEYVTRNAVKYGGAAAFTGALIGDKIYNENYKGDFDGTPIFLGTSDPDFHVPVERVEATAQLQKSMGANVTVKVYKGMGHTISQDEIESANQLIFK